VKKQDPTDYDRDNTLFRTVWTCSPNYKEKHGLFMEADQILDFYFLDSSNGARPAWHKEPDFGARSFLLSLPKDCKLIDWEFPFEDEECFPSGNKNTETWDITFSRLKRCQGSTSNLSWM
jgi:hypothetical protein